MDSKGGGNDGGERSGDRFERVRLSRRSLVGAVGSAFLGGVAGCASTASARATAQMESSGAEVTTPDGWVDELLVHVTANCEYTGFDENEVTHQGFTLAIDGEVVDDDDWSIDHPDFIGELGPDAGAFKYRSFFWKIRDLVPVFEETTYTQEDFYVDEGETDTFEFDLELEWRILSEETVLRTTHLSESTSIVIHHDPADDDSEADVETTTTTVPTETGAASMEAGTVRIWAVVDDDMVD